MRKDIPIADSPEGLVDLLEGLPQFTQAERPDDWYENEANFKSLTRRPYNGQPWTAHGRRGQHPILGLTMRDVGDCVATAFNRARMRDPHAAIGSIDTEALGQEVLVLLEHLMGIYPNIENRT